MAWSPRSVVKLLAVLVLMLLAWPGVAQADRATVVGRGESIQAAVDAADPGDTILVYGTHRENVAIQTDGLTLRGVGAVILPPAQPAPHACIDLTEVGEAVHGVCVIGDVDFDTGEISRYVERVTVSGFTIRNFVGTGLLAVAARDTTFKGNVARNNTDDGVGSNLSLGTRVLSNRASGSRFGIRVFSALGGRIVGNSLHDNCVGMIALASPFGPAGEFRMTANVVRHNTRACPADDDFDALSGIGVGLVGATGTRIVGNLITGNAPPRRYRRQWRCGRDRWPRWHGADRQPRQRQRHPRQRPRPRLGPDRNGERVPAQRLPNERPAATLRLSEPVGA